MPGDAVDLNPLEYDKLRRSLNWGQTVCGFTTVDLLLASERWVKDFELEEQKAKEARKVNAVFEKYMPQDKKTTAQAAGQNDKPHGICKSHTNCSIDYSIDFPT